MAYCRQLVCGQEICYALLFRSCSRLKLPLMVVIGPECTTPARGGTGKTKQGKFMNASKRSGERPIRGHAGHVADCDRLSALQWPQKSKSMLEGQIEGRKSVRPKSRTNLRSGPPIRNRLMHRHKHRIRKGWHGTCSIDPNQHLQVTKSL